jgi:hypothetical protein
LDIGSAGGTGEGGHRYSDSAIQRFTDSALVTALASEFVDQEGNDFITEFKTMGENSRC